MKFIWKKNYETQKKRKPPEKLTKHENSLFRQILKTAKKFIKSGKWYIEIIKKKWKNRKKN